jgi:hypothetical protein
MPAWRLAFSRFFVCEVWRLAYRFKQDEQNGWLSLSETMERGEFEPHSKLDRY